MDLVTMLKGAAPPIVAALLLVSLAGVRLLPLAMAIGLYAAYGLLKHEWPPLPHELWHDGNGTAWLVWGVAAAGLVALLDHGKLLPKRLAVGLGVAVAAVALWLTLAKVASRWSNGDVRLFVAGGGIVVALATVAMRRVLVQAPATIAPAVLWVLMLSVDAVLMVAGRSALLGQMCGAVAAAIGAAVGTTLWRRPFALRPADGVWLGTAHTLFLFAAVHLAQLPWAAAGCALPAPFLLLLLPRGLAERPWRWFAVSAPLVLVPLAVAWWLAQGDGNAYGY